MLTIDELKSLKVGDWVWVQYPDGSAEYAEKGEYSFDPDVFASAAYLICRYSTYGTKWVAYKNKEKAETRKEDDCEYKYPALKAAIFEVCIKLNDKKYNEEFYKITTGGKMQRIERLEEEILKESLAKLGKLKGE